MSDFIGVFKTISYFECDWEKNTTTIKFHFIENKSNKKNYLNIALFEFETHNKMPNFKFHRYIINKIIQCAFLLLQISYFYIILVI